MLPHPIVCNVLMHPSGLIRVVPGFLVWGFSHESSSTRLRWETNDVRTFKPLPESHRSEHSDLAERNVFYTHRHTHTHAHTKKKRWAKNSYFSDLGDLLANAAHAFTRFPPQSKA